VTCVYKKIVWDQLQLCLKPNWSWQE